ncbi:T-complex 11 family protein [Penicillium ucsense]|uniref:T-complex 11 family protein n=1 Tax=Penicillium ucsense TaxID=2839758 RepID=A0A8J8WIV6_9EURO|nr:T-complex 11 family protein [Penicillium ucsense]KAF7735186.1 T-complex 11 family protein [Penicillium ucsense]
MLRRNSDIEIQLPDMGATPLSPVVLAEIDDVEMTSTEVASPLNLPPHIAARFYRRNSKIRRSSTASSRRSSVSSLHSHHSNASSNGPSNADNLAQHLRRTSIIESRKARLADRALHAEKVRLRAALAKAATRNLYSEERALAAQQARERLLAEITAKCEDQVKRAKKKAEDQREKLAAEHARLRLEIAEKCAEAEKRRALYQQSHRRRTSSLPAAVEKKIGRAVVTGMTQEAAAQKIQRTWKAYHAKTVMKEFRALGLSVDQVREMSFEKVGALLSNKTVLETTTKILLICGLQDMEGGAIGARGAVRTFLSSYLIATHPADVLSGDGEQEQDLINKAQELLSVFDQVAALLLSGCCSPTVITSDLQALRESHSVFFSAFHAWKSQDSTVLIDIMLAQFVELELIWQTVKNDEAGGAADDYRQGIRQNQILLLARLKRLAGSDKAMELVRQSLKKAKREKKRLASKQAIPRSTEPAAATSTGVLSDGISSAANEPLSNADATVLQELDEQRASPQERFTKIMTALPENRALVHELLLNKEYKIAESSYTKPRRQVMEHMCEQMRRDVEAGQGTAWTVAMATVIQDRLLRSLQPGNSLHVLIGEVLDPKLVENRCQAGTFSYENFFNFMNTILPRLCAPYRDPIVKEFAEDSSGDAIDRLAKLMGIIDLLSLDHTNFMIQVAAPQLIEEAPGYEKRTFDKGIADGSITLGKTRRFWRTNWKVIVDEMKKRDPENVHGEPRPPSSRVYAHGLVDLILSNALVSEDLIPETLALDQQRLERLHARAFQIVATACILLTAKNLLKRDGRSQWKTEADRILSLDFNEITAERVQSILESTHPMPSSASAQLAATTRRVLGPVATASSSAAEQVSVHVRTEIASDWSSADNSATSSPALSFTDPVAKLILSRLRSHILARMSASSASERVRTTSSASQSLASAGMPEFVGEVGKLVEELEKVREVDWLCHSHVYERLYNEGTSSA